ncbi:MAG: glycosyltransferase family 2 protein [Chloroherpetonaceae bacterium]
MNDKNNILAVVVTYNRLESLKKVIEALRNQTKQISAIVVVNNASTDGTEEWLKSQSDLQFIQQGNIGGAGGFNTGLKYGYENNYEWIWFMDDDVVPQSDCLEKLFDKADEKTLLGSLRYSPSGKVLSNETLSFNFSNPFKTMWAELVSEKELSNELADVEGMTFEGILINRHLIDIIGLPVKDFFLYGDDSDYFIRAKKAGFKIGIATQARVNRLFEDNIQKQWNSPKRYYMVRNVIILDRLYGNHLVRNLRPIIYFFKWFFSTINPKLMKLTIKGFIDGWNYPKQIRNK